MQNFLHFGWFTFAGIGVMRGGQSRLVGRPVESATAADW